MEYTLHILNIKLWEWEGIADKWNTEIIKHGPEENVCDWHNIAVERVKELKKVIELLTNKNKTP